MGAILQDLYRIKELRESGALTKVRKCRRFAEQKMRERDACAKELADYKHWRPQREDELFMQLKRQPVKMQGIDDYKAALSLLRERENVLVAQLEQAEKALASSQAALNEAQTQHANAVKAKEKFAEFLEAWNLETERQQERKEDLEMEEFRVRTLTMDEEELSDG